MPAQAATARSAPARADSPAARRAAARQASRRAASARPRGAATSRPQAAAARRTSTRRAPTGALFAVPVAVGRTAVAVGGLAESGLVHRLTRGRIWIGLLAALLVGIVGLNVVALSLNARTSKTAALTDELKRENSALEAELAGVLSNERLQREAVRLGLVYPEPAAILALRPDEGDAAAAAARLRAGEIVLGAAAAPAAALAVPAPAFEPVGGDDPVVPIAAPAPVEPAAPAEAAAPAPAPGAPEAAPAPAEPAQPASGAIAP